MTRRVVCLACACVLWQLGLPATADARWTQVRTDNFLFIGDAREGDIRRIAETLEAFRAVLAQVLPGANNRSPVPTVVIVFGSNRSFTPYKPRFQGRIVDAAGYFQSGEEINYIAVDGSEDADAIATIFHEYSHFLTDNSAGLVPLWASEGLAQFYETFELAGRSATLGRAIAEHVTLLRQRQLMPLAELMAIDPLSPVYNEGNRRGLFYAQSWALVHYLSLGNRERAPQLREYLTLVASGTAADQAFAQAFGVDAATLERELRDYVRQFTFPAVRIRFDERVVASIPRGTAMADADAEAYLGDLLARQDRGDDARTLLEAVLRRTPDHARAMTALALVDLRADRVDEAIRRLQRAVALAPQDGAIHAALGRAWIEQLDHEETREGREGALREARAALTRAVDLEPDVVHTRAMLGYAEASVGDDLPRAVALLDGAVQRAPAREPYRLMLADALMRNGDYEQATAHLGMLLARGSRASVRESARSLLGRVAALRTARDTPAASPPAPGVLPPTPPPVTGAPAPASAAPQVDEVVPGSPQFVPALRRVQAGEMRVLGTFQQIECTGTAIVIRLETSAGDLRLRAEQFSDVEFIAYVQDPPASVSCGAVPGSPRALATYRAGDGDQLHGVAVAIELIPDDFTPR